MQPNYSHAEPYLAQLKNIEQLIGQNRLQDAALQLNQLVKANSHDPRLFLLGSRLAGAAHNPEGVLVAARKACQLAPQWPVAGINLAGVLASRGEAEEAMTLAEQATIQAPGDPVLLISAASIAQGLHLYPRALQWLRQAEKIRPDDLTIRYKIGLTLAYGGESASAIDIFTDLIQQLPGNAALLSERMRAFLSLKQNAQAIGDGEALLALEPDNEVFQFFLDLARGLTPKTQPGAFIAGLFDSFASQFDRQWVIQWHYQLPRDVAQMIQKWHPDSQGDVLDLGCGTGLLGVCLGSLEGVLVGVDLSGAMLEQAARHQVYSRLHHVNLLDALQATPAELYHVITALDVFIHVGDLEAVIPNAHRILLPNGRFVFSCELHSDDQADYTLHDTYRYTHRQDYVQRLLQAAGFKDIAVEDRVLRLQADQPVKGFLVTARKAAPKRVRSGSRRKAQTAL